MLNTKTMVNSYIKAILDNSPESIVLIGRNHEVLAFNKTISEVLNQYFGKYVKVGDLYYPDFVIDSHKKLYLDTFNKAIQGESLTVQSLTENENVSIWFEYRMTPVYDEEGSLLGVSLSAKDITNEKKAEIKIIELSERLKAVLDNTGESITLLDLDYKILAINKIAIQTIKSNTHIDVLIGSDFREFIPDKTNIFYECYPKALEGKNSLVEISYKNFDGDLLWYQTEFNPVFNDKGEQIGVSVFAKDITAKKNYEISLKESEDRFKKITNLAPIGILITNSMFNINYANNASQKIFEYGSEELGELSISDLVCNLTLNENSEIKLDEFDFEIDTPVFYQEKFEAISKHNRKIDILLSSSNFYSQNKLYYIFIIQDITDIRIKDELISQQNVKLRDIAWHQSHIIRAPLARIMGLISLFQDKKIEIDKTEKEIMYQAIIESAQELDKVIHDIVRKTE
jgi:two-component system, sporulation sensor kinase E